MTIEVMHNAVNSANSTGANYADNVMSDGVSVDFVLGGLVIIVALAVIAAVLMSPPVYRFIERHKHHFKLAGRVFGLGIAPWLVWRFLGYVSDETGETRWQLVEDLIEPTVEFIGTTVDDIALILIFGGAVYGAYRLVLWRLELVRDKVAQVESVKVGD